MTVDLLFPALGSSLPVDHSYPLYAALSAAVPGFHADAGPLRFAPVTGMAVPGGRLELGDRSVLRVRLPVDGIPRALPLAGRSLDVAGSAVRLGVPAVVPLTPAAAVVARLVTFKHGDAPDPFLATARAKLADLGVSGEPSLPLVPSGRWAGQPRRRVVRVKGKTVFGYAVLVTGLSAEHSLRLQERGLGGRTRIGCGFFLPARGDG